eukprot:TRINITY_DN66991_c2_g1_i19.p2 TRINITY_DN66991_c2_g1~~TRINITY_DN66991_c2_g1_i19.p2  ORF type:complete len:262 (-),score=21.29 TRINITY_DN66991_c2_g1_i19:1840-2625(-)
MHNLVLLLSTLVLMAPYPVEGNDCQQGWTGVLCDQCDLGYWGTNCATCECGTHGKCSEGLVGDGTCTCENGWEGTQCTTPTNLSTTGTAATSQEQTNINNTTPTISCMNQGEVRQNNTCACPPAQSVCRNNATMNATDCSCNCVGLWSGPQCRDLGCANGGTRQEDGSCNCPNACAHGEQQPDCSCTDCFLWKGDLCDVCSVECVNGGYRSADSERRTNRRRQPSRSPSPNPSHLKMRGLHHQAQGRTSRTSHHHNEGHAR